MMKLSQNLDKMIVQSFEEHRDPSLAKLDSRKTVSSQDPSEGFEVLSDESDTEFNKIESGEDAMDNINTLPSSCPEEECFDFIESI